METIFMNLAAFCLGQLVVAAVIAWAYVPIWKRKMIDEIETEFRALDKKEESK